MIAQVIMVYFHFKLQHILCTLGGLYLDDFKDFDDHCELIALGLSAVSGPGFRGAMVHNGHLSRFILHLRV